MLTKKQPMSVKEEVNLEKDRARRTAQTEASPFSKQSLQTVAGSKKQFLECAHDVVSRIIINYDVGFGNRLSIRGNGANLSWDEGIVLDNVKPDEWIWETKVPFSTCEFKILINDNQFEIGDNHPLICGTSLQYTPCFE
jgi:hypothetical protein